MPPRRSQDDWLDDPLKAENKTQRKRAYRDLGLAPSEGERWLAFHFAARLKIDGAAFFLTKLLGAFALPNEHGLPLLIHRERAWYAGAFFHNLLSAHDSVLQELNVVLRLDFPLESVGLKKPFLKALPSAFRDTLEKTRQEQWFQEITWFRNTDTHHYLVPMGENSGGWGGRPYDMNVDEGSFTTSIPRVVRLN